MNDFRPKSKNKSEEGILAKVAAVNALSGNGELECAHFEVKSNAIIKKKFQIKDAFNKIYY